MRSVSRLQILANLSLYEAPGTSQRVLRLAALALVPQERQVDLRLLHIFRRFDRQYRDEADSWIAQLILNNLTDQEFQTACDPLEAP